MKTFPRFNHETIATESFLDAAVLEGMLTGKICKLTRSGWIARISLRSKRFYATYHFSFGRE
jgi:hypothetical protein